MTTSDKKNFESSFNDWYIKFIKLEKDLGEQVKKAKYERDKKVEQARHEAKILIKEYEKDQRENMEVTKSKILASHGKDNKGDDLDKKNSKDLQELQNQYEANKGKVIDYLIENLFDVDLELPESIKKKSLLKKNLK